MQHPQPEEEGTPHPGNRIATCNWCGGLITRRNLNRHFRDECQKLPPLSAGQRMCARCQEPRSASDFGNRDGEVNTKQHTCRICSRELARQWFANKQSRIPKEPKRRPARWILNPCEWCGTPFNWAEMKKHRRGCPKRPAKMMGRPPGPSTEVALADMDKLREQSLVTKSRRHKAMNLRYFYGLTMEEFDQLLAKQGEVCAICSKPSDGHDWRTQTLVVDHDHVTGKIRGLLCYKCNHGIGNFLDDPALLIKAVEYLLRHKKLGMVS